MKNPFLEKVAKVKKSPASHNHKLELKIKSNRNVVLAEKGDEVSLKVSPISTHLSSTKMAKNTKRVVGYHVVKYTRNNVSGEKKVFVFLRLKSFDSQTEYYFCGL